MNNSGENSINRVFIGLLGRASRAFVTLLSTQLPLDKGKWHLAFGEMTEGFFREQLSRLNSVRYLFAREPFSRLRRQLPSSRGAFLSLSTWPPLI